MRIEIKLHPSASSSENAKLFTTEQTQRCRQAHCGKAMVTDQDTPQVGTATGGASPDIGPTGTTNLWSSEVVKELDSDK